MFTVRGGRAVISRDRYVKVWLLEKFDRSRIEFQSQRIAHELPPENFHNGSGDVTKNILVSLPSAKIHTRDTFKISRGKGSTVQIITVYHMYI